MPHIRIDVHYTPNLVEYPEAYPGAATVSEALHQDVDNLDPHEILDLGDQVDITVVED